MGCCCWSLPVGENPPTQYNALSFTEDGDYRWSVLWSDIVPGQGGMRVLRDYRHKQIIYVLGSNLIACGEKDGNLHVSAIETSGGSSSIALADSGYAITWLPQSLRGHLSSRVISGSIVFAAIEYDGADYYLRRFTVSNTGTVSRASSNALDFQYAYGILSNPLIGGAYIQMGLTESGEAWIFIPYEPNNVDDKHYRLVSVGSGGESGNYLLTDADYQSVGFDGVASSGTSVYFARAYHELFTLNGNVEWVSATPPFASVTQLFYDSFVYGASGSPSALFEASKQYYRSDDYQIKNVPYSPRDVVSGKVRYLSDDFPTTLAVRDGYLAWVNPASPLSPSPATYLASIFRDGALSTDVLTMANSYDVASDVTFLKAAHFYSGRTHHSIGGIDSSGSAIRAIPPELPNFNNDVGERLFRAYAVDANTAVVSYCQKNTASTGGGTEVVAKYGRSGSTMIEEWRWLGGAAVCPTQDGSSNLYFANLFVQERSALAKITLNFRLLFDDTDWTFNNFQVAADESFLRASLNDVLLSYSTGGTLTGTINETSGGVRTLVINASLDIDSGTTAGTSLLTLTVTLDGTSATEISTWTLGADTTVVYTLDNVDISTAQTATLTTAASAAARTVQFDPGPPPEQMIFPTSFDVQIS